MIDPTDTPDLNDTTNLNILVTEGEGDNFFVPLEALEEEPSGGSHPVSEPEPNPEPVDAPTEPDPFVDVPVDDVAPEPTEINETPEYMTDPTDPLAGLDTFYFKVQEFGDIFSEVQSGDQLYGTTAGDIALMWEAEHVQFRGGPGGDIALAWDGSGALYMGSDGDIADVSNWTGHINLGGGDGVGDILLVTLGERNMHGDMITVTGFEQYGDTADVLVFMQDVTARQTDSGVVFSFDGHDVVRVMGMTLDEVVS